MEGARKQVALRSQSVSHKVATLVWFTGRKQLRHSPLTALKSAGSLIPIPVLGTVVNLAVSAAVDKVVLYRQSQKQAKYRDQASTDNAESLRKAAKSDAKDLKTVMEKIDENNAKLHAAATTLATAVQIYLSHSMAQTVTKDDVWKGALAIYERERYEDKLLVFVEMARKGLESEEKYLQTNRAQTVKLEADFMAELDAIEPQILDGIKAAPKGGGYARI